MTRVTIDPRFCGPPDIGQGGYVAGTLADALGGSDVLVALRAPAPLGRVLTLDADADTARLLDGDTVIAEASRAPLTLDVPPSPSLAEAAAASVRFDCDGHFYPGCFVCGPGRAAGDGWHIFAGPLGEGRVAAPWTPGAPPTIRDLWAALDCPGYFAVQQAAGKALLARMHGHIVAMPPADGPLIIQGWSLGSNGRKHRAATALHAPGGKLLALAEQLWISVG